MTQDAETSPTLKLQFPSGAAAAWVMAQMTWLEARRSHLVALALWTALAGSLVALSTAEAAQAQQGRLLMDMGLMAASLLGTLTAISHTLSTFGDDDAHRSSVLLAHPIPRWSLLTGRLMGLWAVLVVMVAIMGSASLALLLLCGSRPTAIFFWAWALIPVELLVVLTLTQLCATLASRAVAALMTGGLWVAGNLADDFLQLAQSTHSTVTQRRLFTALFAVVPDFTQLTLRQEAANGIAVTGGRLGYMVAYGLCVSLALTTVAGLIFTRRRSL